MTKFYVRFVKIFAKLVKILAIILIFLFAVVFLGTKLIDFYFKMSSYSPSFNEINDKEEVSKLVKQYFYSLPSLPNTYPYIQYGAKTNVIMKGNFRQSSAEIKAEYNSGMPGEQICLILLKSIEPLDYLKNLNIKNKYSKNANNCKPRYIEQYHYSIYNLALKSSKKSSFYVLIKDHEKPYSDGINQGHRTHLELNVYTREYNPECTIPDDKPWPCAPANWFENLPVDPN